jgi:hypothetical protein
MVGVQPATPRMHTQTLGLVKALIGAMGLELSPHVPALLRHCMTVLRQDDTADREPTRQVLEALRLLAPLLDEWLPTAVQRTIDVVKDFNDTPADVRIAAVETLGFMASEVDFGDQQSSLLHAMCRVVVYDVQLRPSVVPVLLTLVRCMGRPFLELGHNHVVDSILKAHCTAAQYADYRALVREIETTAGFASGAGMGVGVGMGSTLSPRSSIQRGNSVTSSTVRLPGDQISEHKQRAVHSGLLKLAKEASGAQGMFKLDSEDWVNRFTMMLFKESSSVRLSHSIT